MGRQMIRCAAALAGALLAVGGATPVAAAGGPEPAGGGTRVARGVLLDASRVTDDECGYVYESLHVSGAANPEPVTASYTRWSYDGCAGTFDVVRGWAPVERWEWAANLASAHVAATIPVTDDRTGEPVGELPVDLTVRATSPAQRWTSRSTARVAGELVQHERTTVVQRQAEAVGTPSGLTQASLARVLTGYLSPADQTVSPAALPGDGTGKGPVVSGSDYRLDGCTQVWQHVAAGEYSSDEPWEVVRPPQVRYGRTTYDRCTGEVRRVSGSAPADLAKVLGRLDSAQVVATVPLTDELTGEPAGVQAVDLAAQGVGDVTTTTERTVQHSRDGTYRYRLATSWRVATVSGTPIADGGGVLREVHRVVSAAD